MTAQPMTLNDLMTLPWKALFARLPDGSFRLTVPQLPDFELFGSKAELTREWKMALRSHLRAYLAYNRVVPLPPLPRPEVVEGTGESFTVNWRVGVA